MSKFCSIVKNEEYVVGCTGQTVWVWDREDNVIAKFKDLNYAYKAAISPKGDIFAVKSGAGKLAFYSFSELSLIKKFRFCKDDYGESDGFCFSADGRSFLNIEHHGDCFNSTITVYNTFDLSVASSISFGSDISINQIQETNGEYYVLGFLRNEDEIAKFFFVAKFKNNEITDMQEINQKEWWFYVFHIDQTTFGFQFDEHLAPVEKIDKVHTLAELWEYCRTSR